MHEFYDAFSYSKHTLKVRTYSTVSDYEMHEFYDAFPYSKYKFKSVHMLRHRIMKCMNVMMHFHIQATNFPLSDLILILSLVISAGIPCKPNFNQL